MAKEMELVKLVDEVLARFSTSSIMLHRPYPPTQFPAVRSRLGGLPQLPEGVEWPRKKGEGEPTPLHFLAQIDCAEMPRIDYGLPTQGMLFFFADDADEQLWEDGEPNELYRVVYAPKVPEDQPHRPAPEGLPSIHGAVSYTHLTLPTTPYV